MTAMKKPNVEQMQDMLWLPTTLPRASDFVRPLLSLTKPFIHTCLDPATARDYSARFQPLVFHSLPISLNRLCLHCSRLYYKRLAEFDIFTTGPGDPRALRAFTSACLVASLFTSLQRFVYLFNSWVPHAIDTFVVLAMQSPKNPRLFVRLEGEVLPWVEMFENRRHFLEFVLIHAKRQRVRDQIAWRPGNELNSEDFDDSENSDLVRHDDDDDSDDDDVSDDDEPATSDVQNVQPTVYGSAPLNQNSPTPSNQEEEDQDQQGLDFVYDYERSSTLDEVEEYEPPREGEQRHYDGMDMFVYHWVWTHQFLLE
ncbi:hypothetical protein L7F22_054100 [Adiantum nelumboides]|nr:hypothetical protein [Adiantum nelumboides]